MAAVQVWARRQTGVTQLEPPLPSPFRTPASSSVPSDYGTFQGVDYRAVLLDDGTVNLLSTAVTCPDAFTAGSTPGRWRRYTRPDELSALAHVTLRAQWRDHPVTVLGNPKQGQVVVSYDSPDRTWADRELTKSEPLL